MKLRMGSIQQYNMIYIVHKSYYSLINNHCACSVVTYSPGFLLEPRRNDAAVPESRGGSKYLVAVTAYQSTALDHPCSPAHLIPCSPADFNESLQDASQLGVWQWLHRIML